MNLERHIVNKTAFTPGLNSQVRGYFISNDSNEIQWAICYIWTGHENAMLEKLTQECLARSLGIPNFFISDPMKPMSVLGLWNFPNEEDAHSIKNKSNYISDYSAIDKAFISALYNPQIRPGMRYDT